MDSYFNICQIHQSESKEFYRPIYRYVSIDPIESIGIHGISADTPIVNLEQARNALANSAIKAFLWINLTRL